MKPASNISGRIRDRQDRPVVNVPVQLLRLSYDAQASATTSLSEAQKPTTAVSIESIGWRRVAMS
jgi:hypothetical protein